jgi:hypothetical protein
VSSKKSIKLLRSLFLFDPKTYVFFLGKGERWLELSEINITFWNSVVEVTCLPIYRDYSIELFAVGSAVYGAVGTE